jgi:hypothetical protein
MNDLKLLGKTKEELPITDANRTFSDDIHMKFRIDMCANIVLKKGKLVHSRNLILNINRELQEDEKGKP